jgi:hypothetical protein
MNVLYSCQCTDGKDREVVVPDRVPDTDILAWMPVVQQCVGYDHWARSPHCPSGVCDLKIPIDDGEAGIGVKATRQ